MLNGRRGLVATIPDGNRVIEHSQRCCEFGQSCGRYPGPLTSPRSLLKLPLGETSSKTVPFFLDPLYLLLFLYDYFLLLQFLPVPSL